MPKIAANLSHLWVELPYLDRFDAASEAGFDGVEVLFPYEVPAQDTQNALRRCNLPMVLINAPPPNYTGGPRGFAAVPGAEERFRYDLRRSLRYCDALKVPTLHVMTGDAEGSVARKTLVENLRVACGMARGKVTLTLEPLNTIGMPNYFLNDFSLAADIIEEVNAPNLRLQYDSFHAQVIHGDAVGVYEAHAHLIGHVQIGDAPNRTPPGTGEVDFNALGRAIKSSGYEGWISAEYTPPQRTEDALEWLSDLRALLN
jgi:hydroxypyruvate isomerase